MHADRRGSLVLVVDDNADTARGMAKLLKLAGHVVRVAHDGPGALEIVFAERPDAVLLDIGLPGMDGIQVAWRIRGHESGKETLLIAVSGHGQADDRRKTKEAGFDHHFIKPVDFDELLGVLSALKSAPID